jgi:hypothetical protein
MSAKSISVNLDSDLLAEAEARAAREELSLNGLVVLAMRRYLDADPEWEALLARTRAAGNALGLRSEADVERISDEFRREKLERTA